MKIFPKGLNQRCAFIVTVFTILCGMAAVATGLSVPHDAACRWIVVGVGLSLIADNIRLLWKHRAWLWPKP